MGTTHGRRLISPSLLLGPPLPIHMILGVKTPKRRRVHENQSLPSSHFGEDKEKETIVSDASPSSPKSQVLKTLELPVGSIKQFFFFLVPILRNMVCKCENCISERWHQ
jgi:hypothetical protein